MNEEAKSCCSFCGKMPSQVKKLIANKNVMICNECVLLCVDILICDAPTFQFRSPAHGHASVASGARPSFLQAAGENLVAAPPGNRGPA